MNKFNYEFGDTVKLVESDETGTVIGRGEFQHSENTYLIRYRAGDGRQAEAWWGESSITAFQS
ncbi:hypothetical protein O4H48_13915 [Rhodobacteraceae bacterium G21628-S1]|nr:hypothetical protein [Rhodobacteraceae bacterium G21628-S1]